MDASSKILWREGLLVLAVALLVKCIGIGHNGFYDEFYHVLAARSWLEDGTFRIAEGSYDRAGAYTIAVAWAFQLFGDSLVTGRMVSALAGAALISLLFVWTASVSNRIAAYLAAFLLCFSPVELFTSQIIRFYTLHALLVWVGAWAVYVLMRPGQPFGRRVVFFLLAIASLAAARSLQVTTLIAVVGLAAWALPAAWLEVRKRGDTHGASKWLAALAGLVLLVAVALILLDRGGIDNLWQSFRRTPLWAASAQNEVLFYHRWLLENYPTLWSLMPVAILAACAIAPRPAVFCTVFLATVIGLHSLAGTKGARYITYAMPFLFALWGIALYGASIGLAELTRRAVTAVLGDVSPTARRLAVPVSFVVAVAFVLASTPALRTSYKMLTLPDSAWPSTGPELRGFPDWQAAAPQLRAIAGERTAVVASAGLKALYFLDRLDFDLNRSVAAEGGGDFHIDPRTGRRLIGSVEAVRTVLECHARGLVVVEQRHWRRDWAVSNAVAELLEQHAQPVELPPDTRLIAYEWSHPAPKDAAECSLRMKPIATSGALLEDDGP